MSRMNAHKVRSDHHKLLSILEQRRQEDAERAFKAHVAFTLYQAQANLLTWAVFQALRTVRDVDITPRL